MPRIWIDEVDALIIHDAQLAEHGGRKGLRDRGLLQSALARPRNRAAYGKADIADLAAAYGYGLARNHPFVDGNKRTAFVCVELFLRLNGYILTAGNTDCVITMLQVAAGTLSEKAFASWLRKNMKKKAAKKKR